MTDGTSQGLFVVVAIVIFGIFVALSYTVFGDTLSPSMENIVLDATNQAESRLNGYTYLDTDLLPSLRAHLDYIVLDSNRYYVDDGTPLNMFAGQLGVRKPGTDVFEIPYYLVRNDRLTGINSLQRLYVENNYTNEPEYNIVSNRVWINGREVAIDFWTSSAGETGVRYHGVIDSGYVFEIGKEYDIDYYLITDNKEVFNFQKTILIENESNSSFTP